MHCGQDPVALLGSADVVLHTGASGAPPTALLRAMAAGVPVVATRVGGVPETGVLVPLQPGPIADAVVALSADPARRERMGIAARRRYLAGFEAVGWARRLRALYDEVPA